MRTGFALIEKRYHKYFRYLIFSLLADIESDNNEKAGLIDPAFFMYALYFMVKSLFTVSTIHLSSQNLITH